MNRQIWDRPSLKQYAKEALKNFYWKAVLATLICSILSGMSMLGNRVNFDFDMDEFFNVNGRFHGLDEHVSVAVLSVLFIVLLIAFVIGSLYSIFVSNPLSVGHNRFYMESRFAPTDIGRVFSGFTGGNYSKTVKTLFIRDLKIWLWSLLFVIPGIIKAYEYSMMPYILAENPSISTERAFQLSKEMTRGRKWDLFVFDLSFFGWQILASILVIGNIFLNPYIAASKTELYLWIRYDALYNGLADNRELDGLFMTQQEYKKY